MPVDKATAYLASRNVKGYATKALEKINEDLVKFEKYDKDGSKTLDREEIKKMLANDYVVGKCEGGFATDKDAENFLKDLDDDGNGVISLEEWMQKIILRWANGTYIRQLIAFDKDHDGKITRQEIHQGLTDDGYTAEELDKFIHDNGMDQDGKVDFKVFIKTFFDVNRS